MYNKLDYQIFVKIFFIGTYQIYKDSLKHMEILFYILLRLNIIKVVKYNYKWINEYWNKVILNIFSFPTLISG